MGGENRNLLPSLIPSLSSPFLFCILSQANTKWKFHRNSLPLYLIECITAVRQYLIHIHFKFKMY
jgi:hypothetical protein